MAGPQYVPLGDLWPTHGLVSVVSACLREAGLHPFVECDPRGWLYFRGWPLGSQRPTTLWIPESERDQALAFLETPFELEEPEWLESAGFWVDVASNRRLIFVLWLVLMIPVAW